MASMTMSPSFLSGNTGAARQLPTTARRGIVLVRASKESEKMVVNTREEDSSKTRRDLMFAMAAAAACSVANIAMADPVGEPKRGTPEAKKKYAPVCVTMPTARICKN